MLDPLRKLYFFFVYRWGAPAGEEESAGGVCSAASDRRELVLFFNSPPPCAGWPSIVCQGPFDPSASLHSRALPLWATTPRVRLSDSVRTSQHSNGTWRLEQVQQAMKLLTKTNLNILKPNVLKIISVISWIVILRKLANYHLATAITSPVRLRKLSVPIQTDNNVSLALIRRVTQRSNPRHMVSCETSTLNVMTAVRKSESNKLKGTAVFFSGVMMVRAAF